MLVRDVRFSMVGLPAEKPNGPNFVSAATAAALGPVGKQAAKACRPVGVGVIWPSEKELLDAITSSSNPPNTNTLFLIAGPPMVNPPNSSFERGGLVSIEASFCPVVRLFKPELFSVL